jgi:hypothetical protein
MNCDKAKCLLGWFHDGELDAPTRKLVAEHLERCPDCAVALADITELDRTSRLLGAPIPPTHLWDRIASQLAAQSTGTARRDRSIIRRRFLMAAGALAASIVGSLVTYGIKRGRTVDGGTGGPVMPNTGSQSDPIFINLATLSPEDRRLVESQGTCAAGGCDARLGAGGRPLKLVLQDQPVFLCCKECQQWARDHPAETLAKLHTLEQQHERSGNEH